MELAKDNMVTFKGKNYVNYSEIQAIYIQLSNLCATYGIRAVARVFVYMVKTGSKYNADQRRG